MINNIENIFHDINISLLSYDLFFDIGTVVKINDYTVDVEMSNKTVVHRNCYVIGKALPDLKQVGIVCYVGNAKLPCFISEKIGIAQNTGNQTITNDSMGKIIVNPFNLEDLSYPTNFTDSQIRMGLEKTFSKHSGWSADMIITPCKKSNINPFTVLGIAQQESGCGTVGKGARTYNPGNIGNVNSGAVTNYGKWESGWKQISDLIVRRINQNDAKTIYNIGGLTNEGTLTTKYRVYATLERYDEAERKHRQNWADNVISFKRQAEGNAK